MTDEQLRKEINNGVFGKVDQQLVLMAFTFLAEKHGGFTVDLNEFKTFVEKEEPIELAWVVDNTGKKLTFTAEAPLPDSPLPIE